LRLYATRGKVVGSIPNQVIEFFFSIYLILPAVLCPGVYPASNRIEYQKQRKMFLGSKALPVLKADNLTSLCEPIV
jgi:hypothetical protein